MEIFKDQLVINEGTINIRLAGDGTYVGNNISVLNFSFGFLDSIENSIDTNPNTVNGNFSLGVFRLKSECYDELKIALKELVILLSEIDTIMSDGFLFKVKFWLGGDLKFLASVLGKIIKISLNRL